MTFKVLKEKAQTLKADGNAAFKESRFTDAVIAYTEALQTCPLCYAKERSIMYSNRAAAKLHMVSILFSELSKLEKYLSMLNQIFHGSVEIHMDLGQIWSTMRFTHFHWETLKGWDLGGQYFVFCRLSAIKFRCKRSYVNFIITWSLTSPMFQLIWDVYLLSELGFRWGVQGQKEKEYLPCFVSP